MNKSIIGIIIAVIVVGIAAFFLFGSSGTENKEQKENGMMAPEEKRDAAKKESNTETSSSFAATVEEEIKFIKEKFGEKKLIVVLLNQYGNPLNLGHAYRSTGLQLFDALDEPVKGNFVAMRTRNIDEIKSSQWDDDTYIYQFSEEISEGTYTLRFDIPENGQIGPTANWHAVYDLNNLNGEYTVARFYESPVEQTISVPTKEGLVVRVAGTQKDSKYKYWAVCATFKNRLGTELEVSGLNATSKITSETKLIHAIENHSDLLLDTFHQTYVWGENEHGRCIKSTKHDRPLLTFLDPGKYEWRIAREGYEPAIIPFELPDVSAWSDDQVRSKNVPIINVGEIILEKTDV
jgi:hypothetical protein